MKEWDDFDSSVGQVTRLQVESELSPHGAQVLCTISSDSSEKPKYFFLPLAEDNTTFNAILRLLLEALLHRNQVRITHEPVEEGTADRIIAVRLHELEPD